MLLQILLKLHEHRGVRIGEKAPVNDFVRFPVPRIIAEVKYVTASFRCYDNPDVIATLIMTNFPSWYNCGGNFSKCVFMAT